MPKVIHFEISADNPQRAVKFYTEAFGWQIQNWGDQPYWLATTGPEAEPGINGAIMPREEKRTTVNIISVTSLEETSEKITRAGGKLTTPRTAVPGIGYFRYCQDMEGNTFGIMQSDPDAK
jgi:hypothetical protein